jgi:hypothetical protein
MVEQIAGGWVVALVVVDLVLGATTHEGRLGALLLNEVSDKNVGDE